MDGLTLLRCARALGFTVGGEDGRVVVRGPKQFAAVARCLLEHKAAVLGALPCATEWPEDAQDRFLERLGVADDLGLDTAPGSDSWCTAVREARRAAADVPEHLRRTREPDLIDVVLKAFAALADCRVGEPRVDDFGQHAQS
jgi:hypothetical protein